MNYEPCGVPCPEFPVITCRLNEDNHEEHFGGYGEEAMSWPNLGYVPPGPEDNLTGSARTKAHLMAMARRLREAQ